MVNPAPVTLDARKLTRVTSVFASLQFWRNKTGGFGDKLVKSLREKLEAAAGGPHAGEAPTSEESLSVTFTYKGYLEGAYTDAASIPTGARAKMLGAILEGLPKDIPSLGEIPVVLGVLDNIVFSQGRVTAGP